MPIRLTILLLLLIFGAMYLAPDAPPRPDRVAAAPSVPAGSAPSATPDPAPGGMAPTTPDPLPRAEAPPEPAPPPPALLLPDRTETADLPTVTVTPPPDDSGPITLPGLGFGASGDDTGAALSLSDGARARAAQAARDALEGAPDNPIVNSVSEAANDLLRGLTADGAATPTPPPVTVITPPRPTDPTPPPAGQIARVTGTAVNLRAGPSTANAVVGQVTLGQTVRVLDPDRDGWAAIENPATGNRAFISSRFLDLLP